MRFPITTICVIFSLLCSLSAHSQVAHLPSTEIEQRNAAAAFAYNRAMSLYLLLGECKHLMARSSASMEVIARGWFDRNKPELEASYVWMDRYLSYLKATDPDKYKQAYIEFIRVTADGLLKISRIFFAREQPDTARCEKVSRLFSGPHVDFKNMWLNPGYEQFAEFLATLRRIRAEPDFFVPPQVKNDMDIKGEDIYGLGNRASLDAAEAAKERGDGHGRIAVFKNMAERGDKYAAQVIGLIYMSGDQVEKNPVEAYRWFYAAWSLSEPDGLTALGVMTRDGIGVPVNLPLAATMFYVAKSAARDNVTFNHASRNLHSVENRISAEEKSRIACMSWRSLDDTLRAPIHGLDALVKGESLLNPDGRLGEIVADLAEAFKTSACR